MSQDEILQCFDDIKDAKLFKEIKINHSWDKKFKIKIYKSQFCVYEVHDKIK